MEERLYDLIFICMPATPEEEITRLIGVLEQAVADKGARLEKIEKWGARKMAYRVSKQREGYYVYGIAQRAGRGYQGTRAPVACRRPGDQVHDRAAGRRDQTAAEIGWTARTSREAATAEACGRERGTWRWFNAGHRDCSGRGARSAGKCPCGSCGATG
jgi:ribosomal protein S6